MQNLVAFSSTSFRMTCPIQLSSWLLIPETKLTSDLIRDIIATVSTNDSMFEQAYNLKLVWRYKFDSKIVGVTIDVIVCDLSMVRTMKCDMETESQIRWNFIWSWMTPR